MMLLLCKTHFLQIATNQTSKSRSLKWMYSLYPLIDVWHIPTIPENFPALLQTNQKTWEACKAVGGRGPRDLNVWDRHVKRDRAALDAQIFG